VADTVTLSFGAQTENVALARTLAATMSARAELPPDQIEDVRLAVDEVVRHVIAAASSGVMAVPFPRSESLQVGRRNHRRAGPRSHINTSTRVRLEIVSSGACNP
jgi:hypothetical protein